MQISPIDFAIISGVSRGHHAVWRPLPPRPGRRCAIISWAAARAPWWALACSIVATETSTLTIIGTPGIAYGGNLGFLQLVLGYLVARVILCVVLIPQYFQGEFYTAYQLLEKRFGVRMKIGRGSDLSGDARAGRGRADFGNRQGRERGVWHRRSHFDHHCMPRSRSFYTFEGGMRAVIWTDVIQFALYLARARSRRSFCCCTKFPAAGPP